MFNQYVKDNEMIMMVEFNNICKSFSSIKSQLVTPFLTTIYSRNKKVDLLEFLLHFSNFVKQLKKDKEAIVIIISKESGSEDFGVNLLSSLKDLIIYVSSLSLSDTRKTSVRKIAQKYNL